MKRLIALSLFIIFFKSPNAQTIIDVLSGHKGLVSEFFFLKPIDEHERWLAVSRSELHLPDYKKDYPEFLNFNTFSYNLKNHIGFTVGTYASSHYQFSARLGLQYFRENEHYLFYTNLSSAVTNNPDGQLLVIGSYLPAISEHWRLFTRAEWRTAVNYKEGFAFSNQIVKLGLQYKGLAFGIGAELEQLNDYLGENESNIGAFIRLTLDK